MLVASAVFSGQSTDLTDQFFAAARKGDVATVKALLDKGVDVNAKTKYGATALSYAADHGSLEVAKLLIERGADVNVRDTFYGEVPLGWAVSRGSTELVKLLLSKGARGIDRVLLGAASDGNVEMLKIALEAGRASETSLSMALSMAAKANKPEAVELLKKSGAQPFPVVQLDEQTLTSYSGTYKWFGENEAKISTKDGKLFAQIAGGVPFQLTPISKSTFIIPGESIFVTFNVEANKVTGFTFKQGDQTTIFPKLEQK